jgi:hypothetical protein
MWRMGRDLRKQQLLGRLTTPPKKKTALGVDNPPTPTLRRQGENNLAKRGR